MSLPLDAGAIAPGQMFRVDVHVDNAAPGLGEEVEPITLHGASQQKQFHVEVWLTGSAHFEILDPRVLKILILEEKPASKHVQFKVRVKETLQGIGDASLCAYFTYKRRPCGCVRRSIKIEDTSQDQTPPSLAAPLPRIEIDAAATTPDLTIEITDPTRSRQHFHCRVSSPLLRSEEQPPEEEWHLPIESGHLVQQYMAEFMKPGISSTERILSLKGAGRQLFDAAPGAFKELFWKLIDRSKALRSILLVSQEPYIPWELMIPWRRLSDGVIQRREALGLEFSVGRWPHEGYLSPRQRIPLTDSYIVAPMYPGPRPRPLQHAKDESELVRRAIPGDPIDPADLDTINAKLVESGRSLLHFVCHGADSPGAGIQVVYLNGGTATLSSLQVGELKGMIEAFKKRPLVFINACEVGRPALALVGIGGFAAAFISLGASAVIAPLWSVKDTSAFKVAEMFYREISRGPPRRSFAEILREIRALAYDDAASEDTYASYCFYGDPLAVRS